MDCSPPGCSIHGILQARVEWSGLPFPSPGYLPNPGIEPASHKSALAGGFFTTSATWDSAVLLVRPLGQSWVTWYVEWQRDLRD